MGIIISLFAMYMAIGVSFGLTAMMGPGSIKDILRAIFLWPLECAKALKSIDKK